MKDDLKLGPAVWMSLLALVAVLVYAGVSLSERRDAHKVSVVVRHVWKDVGISKEATDNFLIQKCESCGEIRKIGLTSFSFGDVCAVAKGDGSCEKPSEAKVLKKEGEQ